MPLKQKQGTVQTNRLIIYLMACFEYIWNTNDKQSRTQMLRRPHQMNIDYLSPEHKQCAANNDEGRH